MIFLLEDDPLRVDWFRSKFRDLVVARSVTAALYTFEGLRPEMVFLDHDLEYYAGSDSYCELTHSGLAFVKSALADDQRFPGLWYAKKIVIHSVNPDGAKAMFLALHDAGIYAEVVPFTSLKERLVIE